MRTILISHSWDEDTQYRQFVSLLDEILGLKNWRNVSIPRDQALGLVDFKKAKDEMVVVDAEITQLRARLDAHDLPDVCVRIVYDAQGRGREMPTRGSVGLQLAAAIARRRELESRNPIESVSQGERLARMQKGPARQINLHPELSLAIRARVQEAEIVFVLITSMCMFRTWIDYEVKTAMDLGVPIVAVMAGGTKNRALSIDCTRVIPWERERVREILQGPSKRDPLETRFVTPTRDDRA